MSGIHCDDCETRDPEEEGAPCDACGCYQDCCDCIYGEDCDCEACEEKHAANDVPRFK